MGRAQQFESEDSPTGEEQSERTAQQRKQRAFRQELTQDSNSPSAKRDANADFAVAGGCTSEE